MSQVNLTFLASHFFNTYTFELTDLNKKIRHKRETKIKNSYIKNKIRSGHEHIITTFLSPLFLFCF